MLCKPDSSKKSLLLIEILVTGDRAVFLIIMCPQRRLFYTEATVSTRKCIIFIHNIYITFNTTVTKDKKRGLT